jgi:hypothetical protein
VTGGDLGPAATALAQLAAAGSLAAALDRRGIPVLVLKGPPLQQRLFGTPAAYESVDVDLLVPADRAAEAVEAARADGWARLAAENALFWRLSQAVVLVRGGVAVDLHWGVHAGHLPAGTFRALTAALWAGATVRSDGLREPAPEPLFVYLAAHAAGHGFDHHDQAETLAAAAAQVRSWPEVERLAAATRLRGTVARARAVAAGGRTGGPVPVLDGPLGVAWWAGTWLARGRFVPRAAREGLRARLRRR